MALELYLYSARMLSNFRKENLIMIVVQTHRPITKTKLNCLFLLNIDPPLWRIFYVYNFNFSSLYQILNQNHIKNSHKQEIA